MEPRCPICSNVLPEAVPPSCPFCEVALQTAGNTIQARFPEIKPGELLLSVDMARDPPLGRASRTDSQSYDDKEWWHLSPAPNGVVLEDRGRIETVFVDRRVALRDGCASLSATVLDDGARPAVVLRERTYGFRDLRQRTTEFSNRYQLMIDPGKRKLSLSRAMDLRRTKLVVKKKHPAVAPLGQPNVIELRAHGPTLEAWINGQRVATVHDPEYGFGCAGFLVNYGYDRTPEGQPCRTLLRSFSLSAVGR